MKTRESSGFLTSSFTDLMASLAVIFILLTVVFIKNAAQRSQKGKEAVRMGLAEVLDKNKLPLVQDPADPLSLSVRVSEGLLKFTFNSARVPPDGSQFLNTFVPALAQQLCAENIRSKLDAVVIEGHTDRSGEVTASGTSHNIRLSQERAFSVLSEALQAVRNNPDLYECLLNLVSASGRGSRSPVVTEAGYDADLSRRVEIKIRLKSSEQSFLLKDK